MSRSYIPCQRAAAFDWLARDERWDWLPAQYDGESDKLAVLALGASPDEAVAILVCSGLKRVSLPDNIVQAHIEIQWIAVGAIEDAAPSGSLHSDLTIMWTSMEQNWSVICHDVTLYVPQKD